MYITGRYDFSLNVFLDCTEKLTEGYLQSMYVSVNLPLTELRLELESLYQETLVVINGLLFSLIHTYIDQCYQFYVIII